MKTAEQIQDLKLNLTPSTYIFDGIGATFSTLKKLWISNQNIKFVQRENFANLEQLTWLNMQQNKIEFLSENVFWDLPNLLELDFQSNRIKKLPEKIFENLLKIENIWFERNKIEHLSANLFETNTELTMVRFSGNPLKIIDVDFSTLPNLKRLFLYQAKCVDFIAKTHARIPEVQKIINQNCSAVRKYRPEY